MTVQAGGGVYPVHAVRQLLTGDALEEAERDIERISEPLTGGATEVPPRLHEARCHLDELLEAPPLGEAVSKAVGYLTSITTFDAVNDPTKHDSEILWLHAVVRLLQRDVSLAGAAARAWNARLFDLGLDDDRTAEIRHRPLTAYILGVVETVLGRDVRAERWLEEGHVGAEIEEIDSMSTMLRAVRTVRDAALPCGAR